MALLLTSIAVSPLSVLNIGDALAGSRLYNFPPEFLNRFSRRPDELRSWIPTAGFLLFAALLARRAARRA